MPSTILLSDNGASSGSAGLKQTAGNDGVLILQTTTSGGSATNAVYVDNKQNLGFGTTPSGWTVYTNVLQTSGLALATNGTAAVLGANWYYDGQNRYKANGYASLYIQSDGAHTWFTAASGSTGNTLGSLTTIMSVDKDKSLALQGATSQSGTGISFPAAQSASTDANTLDDYEEGTWTGTLTIGGTSNVSGTGNYTKIGRVVYWNVTFYNETWTRSGTGNIAVTGFPFTSTSSANGAASGGGSYAGYKFILPNDTWLSGGQSSTTQTLFNGGGPVAQSAIASSGFLFEVFTGWYIAS